MKKTFVLLLILAISVSLLSSCVFSDYLDLEKADAALREAPFKVEMSFNYETDNEEVATVFDAMSSEIPFIIDGDSMYYDMTYQIYGYDIGVEMTFIDGTIYMHSQALGTEQRKKATLSEEEILQFKADNSASMPVDYFKFEEVETETKDGKKIITLSNITTDGLEDLKEAVAAAFEGTDVSMTVDDISYIITLKDGKYEQMDLACTYTVSASGESITIRMTATMKYSYEDIAKITAPTDAADYTSVSYSEIIGQ